MARLQAGIRASAETSQIAPAIQQHVLPFDIDSTSVAPDSHGRVWVAIAGQPDLARFDPASGEIQEYQYAAASVAANPIQDLPLGIERMTPAPGAVWITRIVAMVCDGRGDLWYIRAGSDEVEEVTP